MLHKGGFDQSLLLHLKLDAVHHGQKGGKKNLLLWLTVGAGVVI